MKNYLFLYCFCCVLLVGCSFEKRDLSSNYIPFNLEHEAEPIIELTQTANSFCMKRSYPIMFQTSQDQLLIEYPFIYRVEFHNGKPLLTVSPDPSYDTTDFCILNAKNAKMNFSLGGAPMAFMINKRANDIYKIQGSLLISIQGVSDSAYSDIVIPVFYNVKKPKARTD